MLSLTAGSPSAGVAPTGNGSSTVSRMRSKSRFRLADFSSFESCSASVSARSSVSNCSRTGPSTASSRIFSSSVFRLDRTCTWRVMSSSVESIVSSGESSAAISSTTPAASRMPSRRMRSRIRSACDASSLLVSDVSSHFGLPALRARSSCASQSLMISTWACSSAASSVSSGISSAPASTIVSPSLVPTTIRSSVLSFSVSCSVGLTTSRPSIIPMRTAPTGPLKGSGEIISAAEAPFRHRMSCGVTRSAESTVQITCTSLRKPFGQSGRIGRSIIRAVRIARSVGLPSRLKKPPGIFPAAYIRSSTSTVSGKKSAPSRASIRPCAVASTIVSPARTTTEPSACLASLPDSNVSSWSPTVTDTVAVRGSVFVAMWASSTFRGEWRFESASTGSTLAQTSTLRLGLGSLVGLPPQAELLNEGAIALEVALLQVLQEPPAAADELEQAAARVVVLRVRPQVLGQLVDASRQQRDLHFRRAGVALGVTVLADDLQLRFLGQSQFFLLLQRLRNPSPPRGSSRKRPRLRSCARVASQTGIPGEPRPLLTAVRMQSMRAAIAAGHPATVEAGIEILAEGGSAADAAVAACLASCVAETVMTGLLGGGHAIYFEASSGRARNLDCFVAVPGLGASAQTVDPVELEVPFGTELVHYTIGIASCGVPGVPAGLDALHRRHGRLPWTRLVEPALRLARDGVDFPQGHAACLAMIAPVMTMNDGARIYSPGGELLPAGGRLEQPGLVPVFELLCDEGARTFYEGSLAQALLALMDERGGLVARADLEAYEATWAHPVELGYAGTRFLTRGGLSTVPAALSSLPRLRGLAPGERALALARALDLGGTEGHTTNLVTADD